jgi:subtilase family serine protease
MRSGWGRRGAAATALVAGVLLLSVGAPAASPPAAAAASSAAVPACPPAPPGVARCLARFTDAVPDGTAASSSSHPHGLTPADLRSAYALPTGGQGAIVAVVDAYDDPNFDSDLAVYRSTFGLPPCTVAGGCLRRIDATGTGRLPAANATWSKEISLDLDMVSAACPACHLVLVEAGGQDIPSLGAAENVAAAVPGVVAIANSWGVLESAGETGWDHFFNHPGIAVVAASGDFSNQPVYPAASPWVTAVGGTTLRRSDSTARGWKESAWRDAGSGCSAYEPKPSWQHDASCAHRSIADVAAVADPATGVAVYDTYQWPGWVKGGGTSIGAPLIAAVYALAGNARSIVAASFSYAHSDALNRIGDGYTGPTGLGTPNGTGGF